MRWKAFTFLYDKFAQDNAYQILSQSVRLYRLYIKKHFCVFFGSQCSTTKIVSIENYLSVSIFLTSWSLLWPHKVLMTLWVLSWPYEFFRNLPSSFVTSQVSSWLLEFFPDLTSSFVPRRFCHDLVISFFTSWILLRTYEFFRDLLSFFMTSQVLSRPYWILLQILWITVLFMLCKLVATAVWRFRPALSLGWLGFSLLREMCELLLMS